MWDAGETLAVVIGVASLAGFMAAVGVVLGLYYSQFG